MNAWRYTTVNCQRIWRLYARVGPAERPSWFWPCSKAAIIGAPLALAPASMAPGAGPLAELAPVPAPPVLAPGADFLGGWPEMPAQGGIEYAAVGGGVPIPELAQFGGAQGQPTEVPEPSSLWIYAGAALAAVWGRR